MKILTTLTKEYLPIYNEIFVPNLSPNTELITQYFNYELDSVKGKFGSHDTLYKLPFILNVLNGCKEGEIICYCDVDVAIISEQFGKDLTDETFQIQWDSPDGGVCIGLMFIRNNIEARWMINEFLKADVDWIIENYGFSLKYFRYLLDKLDISYKHLPFEYYGGQMREFNIPKPSEIFCYHATYEDGILNKLLKLKEFIK